MEERTIKVLKTIAHVLSVYHRHEALGLENIPKKGAAIIAVNHSFVTYDMLLLGAAIHSKTSRALLSAADRWFFKSHTLGPMFEAVNMFEGTRENALKVLADKQLLLVAPGGMYEAMQATPGKIFWNDRKGFAKLAIQSQSPVILVACPKADEIYTNYAPKSLGDFFYQNFKIPFALLRGVGITPIPKPIKLTHLIDKPVHPPSSLDDLDDFHKMLSRRMEKLMVKAAEYR